MTNPPEKIWYNPDQFDAGPVKLNDHEVQYIRADLVTEQRKPLSEEEIAAEFTEPYRTKWSAFWNGVRFAERHHGIGEGDE